MEVDIGLPGPSPSHFSAFTNFILLYQFLLCISPMANLKKSLIKQQLLLQAYQPLATEPEAHDLSVP